MAKVTGLSGNEIYCLALKGYSAGEMVVGNSVNSMGFLGSLGAGLNNILGGEIPQVTQAIQDGRMHAFGRMAREAQSHGATGVTGVSGDLRGLSGNTEFLFVGSCVFARDGGGPFFTTAGDAQELYCHMDAGYAPVQHVFGNVAYSMGVGGGILGALKQLARGEISELTTLVHDAREHCIDRLKREADSLGAEEVVGVKTYIIEIGQGLIEFMAIGTAVRKTQGMGVQTQNLPPQAIVRDRDTWVDGDSGFSLMREVQGN